MRRGSGAAQLLQVLRNIRQTLRCRTLTLGCIDGAILYVVATDGVSGIDSALPTSILPEVVHMEERGIYATFDLNRHRYSLVWETLHSQSKYVLFCERSLWSFAGRNFERAGTSELFLEIARLQSEQLSQRL